MKKLMLVLAIGAFAACNDSSTENAGTSDSATVAPADTASVAPADTTSIAPVDTTAAPVDSAAKK